MKECTRCKIEKVLADFNFKDKKTKKYQSSCKECTRKAGKKHYDKNSKKVIKNNIARRRKYRKQNHKWKTYMECTTCDEKSTVCIDFHHINPKDKRSNIAHLLTDTTINIVMEEALKCIVVCSNCHRKVHANEIILTAKHKARSEEMMYNAFTLVA